MPKTIDNLTEDQKSKMAGWVKKWIEIGLRTGETDWATFDKYMPICYDKAKLKYPKNVVRVSSPLVGAFAASIAGRILNNGEKFGGAVDDAVDGAVGGAVDDAVSKGKLNWHYWLGGQFWVGYYWWGSPAFVSFFTKVCNLELSKDIMERAEAYSKICESVNYIWPNKDFVIVCARPKKINRDERGRLHSTTEKSIEYPDGWGLYHLYGVLFDKQLWTEVTSKMISAKKVLLLTNLEQRMAAMKFLGSEWLLETLGGKEIDKGETDIVGSLWQVSIPDVHDSAKLIKFRDPSTDRIYILGVPPEIMEVHEAQAWLGSMKKEEYQSITIQT